MMYHFTGKLGSMIEVFAQFGQSYGTILHRWAKVMGQSAFLYYAVCANRFFKNSELIILKFYDLF